MVLRLDLGPLVTFRSDSRGRRSRRRIIYTEGCLPIGLLAMFSDGPSPQGACRGLSLDRSERRRQAAHSSVRR
jgi:hypothetical protein